MTDPIGSVPKKATIGFAFYTGTHGSFLETGPYLFGYARKADPFGSVPDPFPCKRNEIVTISYPTGMGLLDPHLFISCKRDPDDVELCRGREENHLSKGIIDQRGKRSLLREKKEISNYFLANPKLGITFFLRVWLSH